MTRNTPVLMTVMAASLTSICKSPQKSQNNTLDPDYPAQFHIPAAESNFITEEKISLSQNMQFWRSRFLPPRPQNELFLFSLPYCFLVCLDPFIITTMIMVSYNGQNKVLCICMHKITPHSTPFIHRQFRMVKNTMDLIPVISSFSSSCLPVTSSVFEKRTNMLLAHNKTHRACLFACDAVKCLQTMTQGSV